MLRLRLTRVSATPEGKHVCHGPAVHAVDRAKGVFAPFGIDRALIERQRCRGLASAESTPRRVRTSRWFQPGLLSRVRSVRLVAGTRLGG